jgi:hypothetical protein
MMRFDFSGMNTFCEEEFKVSFSHSILDAVLHFINHYHVLFPDYVFTGKDRFEITEV